MAGLTLQVSASTDDARNINGDGTFNATVVTQHLGILTSVDYWTGLRWLGASVPPGASIVYAKIDLFSSNTSAGSTANVIFYGNLTGNATTFANNTANKPEGKTRTSASVAQSFGIANWSGIGFGKELINVESLVQEIINGSGFSSGNAIAIVGHDNGSANDNYVAHSTFNSNPVRGAILGIEYSDTPPPAAEMEVYIID